MNEHIQERFDQKTTRREDEQAVQQEKPVRRANRSIRDYYLLQDSTARDATWLSRAAVPTTREMLGLSDAIELPINRLDGAWSSAGQYLSFRQQSS